MEPALAFLARPVATNDTARRTRTKEATANAHELLRDTIGQYEGESDAHFDDRVRRALEHGAAEAAAE